MEWINLGAGVTEKDGILTADTGNVLFSAAQDRAVLFSRDRAPANFTFECEIRLVRDGEAGVYFRAEGKNGFSWIAGYCLSVNAADCTVKLSKVNGGDRNNSVLGSMRYPFEKNRWYKIRVEMQGSFARVWFNNFLKETDPYPKFDLELRHFPRGTVGLEFGEGVAEFRGITLTELEEAPVYDRDSCYCNPVIYGADPDILYWNGTYYLYFTDTQDMSLFQCYTSKDLIHWSEPVVVFHGTDGWGDNEYMSPNVFYKDGLFYMTYASHTAPDETGKRRVQVAFASSTSPLGPFRSKTMKPLHEDFQEICGHPFVDDDGRTYLSVVRFNKGNEIWAYEVKLEDGIITPLDDTITKLLVPTEEWECDYARIVEGGVIIKHKGLYYMMYAGSHYKGSYAEGFAVAEHPLGPYRKYRYNPILRSTGFTRGTGDSVYTKTADGRYIMFYHQHFSPTEISPRYICYDPMKFVETEEGIDVLVVHGPTGTPQKGLIPKTEQEA